MNQPTTNTITRILKVIAELIPIVLAFLVAMVFSRFFEWGLLAYYHGTEMLTSSYLLISVVRDMQITLLAVLPLGLIYLGLKKILPGYRYFFISILIVVAAIVNGALISYFSSTLIPLGPEFWAYSTKEMTDTVWAADRFSFWGLLLSLMAVGVLFGTIRKMVAISIPQRRYKSLFLGLLPVPVLFFGLSLWTSIGTEKNVSQYSTNKLAYFISHSMNFTALSSPEWEPDNDVSSQGYPFLHKASDEDVLGSYFKDISNPPNIVFLIVESLGGEFVGKEGKWSGFTPYLDSLSANGLYWENGLSLSGRTFGMMPSLFGSLPPARNGFMEVGPDYPNHLTLMSLLNEKGYNTSYYSGFNTYFDKLNYFLDYQGIDFLLNKQNIEEQFDIQQEELNQNYWGYDDKSMFNIASTILDTVDAYPRLEIYHTLQSHSPFTVPDNERYAKKFDGLINEIEASEKQRNAFQRYRSELTTLLYTDEAIKEFMQSYKKRDQYENTIFVITGDHWLIPVPQSSQISRYHVPIIIHSPLLKKPVHFESVNTHANIIPSILTFLSSNTELGFPDSVHWMGGTMDTVQSFRNIHSLPLMKNKNQLTDYIDGQYYLSGNNLFRLTENLGLKAASDEKELRRLQGKLSLFKKKSKYAISNNKLYPETQKKMPDKYDLIARYDTLFHRIDKNKKTVDEQFELARQFAFNQRYEPARAIGERLLLQNPGYHDVRLLVARTYAWEQSYEKAREKIKQVISRDSTYRDAYNALFDTEYWSGNYQTALEVINKGLEYHSEDAQFLKNKIWVLVRLDKSSQAEKVFQKLKDKHPAYDKLDKVKQYIAN